MEETLDRFSCGVHICWRCFEDRIRLQPLKELCNIQNVGESNGRNSTEGSNVNDKIDLIGLMQFSNTSLNVDVCATLKSRHRSTSCNVHFGWS